MEKIFSKGPVYVVRSLPDNFDHQFFYDKEVVAVDGLYRRCKTAKLNVFTRQQEYLNASEWRISGKSVILEPVTLPVSEKKPIDDFPELKEAISAGAKEIVLVGYPPVLGLLAADNGKVKITVFEGVN
jgi:hypothetical protein